MRRSIVGFAVMLAGLSAGPAAADEAEVVRHYQDSQAAWADGRSEDADRAGEAAWRAAEAEWGASANTGVLAANLARRRLLMGLRAEALAPAQRAAQLARDGVAPDVPLLEAALTERIAAFDPEAAGPEAIAELEAAARQVQAATAPGEPLVWLALLDVARAQEMRRAWRAAEATGQEALSVMEAGGEPPDWAPTQAMIVLGRVASEQQNFRDAAQWFQRAFARVPQEDAAGEINPLWAQLMVWADAMEASHRSVNENELNVIKDIDGPRYRAEEDDCDAEWQVRYPARYPRSALRKGSDGAALVSFTMTAAGKPANIAVHAAFPEELGFETAAKEAVETWQADMDTMEGCDGVHRFSRLLFVLK